MNANNTNCTNCAKRKAVKFGTVTLRALTLLLCASTAIAACSNAGERTGDAEHPPSGEARMRAAGNADYVAPADPGAPAAPADRRAPAGYAGPMDPVDPATPADPRNPADYAGPMDPGASEDGGKPPSKADRLERLAQGVAGVEGATCVVFGKFAIVGIDVDAKLERSQVGTIKYAVAEAFRKDPDGVDAIVTADIDLTQRLREIGADIRHGRPVAGFTEELADIVGRLVPQLPRSVMPAREPEDLGIRSSEPQTAR